MYIVLALNAAKSISRRQGAACGLPHCNPTAGTDGPYSNFQLELKLAIIMMI